MTQKIQQFYDRPHRRRRRDSSSSSEGQSSEEESDDPEEEGRATSPKSSSSNEGLKWALVGVGVLILLFTGGLTYWLWKEHHDAAAAASSAPADSSMYVPTFLAQTPATEPAPALPTSESTPVAPSDLSTPTSSPQDSSTSSSFSTSPSSDTSSSSSTSKQSSPASSPTSPSPPASSSSPPSTAPSSDCDENCTIILAAHNTFRALHHASPLVWNTTLTTSSTLWAKKCVFEHSGGKLIPGGYGENLAAQSPASGNLKREVEMWNNEEAQYDYNNPGFGESTGHFTQVVWKATESVGCFNANCMLAYWKASPSDFLVCQYHPAGNMVGDGNSYFK